MSTRDNWEELRAVWGPYRLGPIEYQRLADAPVSEEIKDFLTGPGLPFESPLLVNFYHDGRLLQPVVFKDIHYLLVGDDTGTLLGLRVGTDELWSIEGSRDQPLFVNSCLWDFVFLLRLYEKRVPGLEQQIAAQDAKALGHVGYWWSVIVEQMGYGFL